LFRLNFDHVRILLNAEEITMKLLSLLKVNLKYTPFVKFNIVHLDIILASVGEPFIFDDMSGHNRLITINQVMGY